MVQNHNPDKLSTEMEGLLLTLKLCFRTDFSGRHLLILKLTLKQYYLSKDFAVCGAYTREQSPQTTRERSGGYSVASSTQHNPVLFLFKEMN